MAKPEVSHNIQSKGTDGLSVENGGFLTKEQLDTLSPAKRQMLSFDHARNKRPAVSANDSLLSENGGFFTKDQLGTLTIEERRMVRSDRSRRMRKLR